MDLMTAFKVFFFIEESHPGHMWQMLSDKWLLKKVDARMLQNDVIIWTIYQYHDATSFHDPSLHMPLQNLTYYWNYLFQFVLYQKKKV